MTSLPLIFKLCAESIAKSNPKLEVFVRKNYKKPKCVNNSDTALLLKAYAHSIMWRFQRDSDGVVGRIVDLPRGHDYEKEAAWRSGISLHGTTDKSFQSLPEN